jgi:hypothetical protein
VNFFKLKCINDIVIIDGLTRSGKFYLGKLISSINGLEYFINSSEIERLIQMHQVGMLKSSDAAVILKNTINESIYNMAIGRNINMKHGDGSSVLNSFEKDLYINRQRDCTEGELSIKKIINQKRSSVFLLHNSLKSLELFKELAPNLKIINIRRHPIDLAYSWIKKGWGYRFENDPLSFDLTINNGLPYFANDWANDWADEYLSGNEYDKVIISIVNLVETENSEIEKKQYDICSIFYENLVFQANQEISNICNYLDRSPHESMNETILNETIDTNLYSQREIKLDYISAGAKNVSFLSKLIDLGKKYDKNIKGNL